MKVKDKAHVIDELEALHNLLVGLKECKNQQEQAKTMLLLVVAKLEEIEKAYKSLEEELDKDTGSGAKAASAGSNRSKGYLSPDVSAEIQQLIDDLPFYVLLVDKYHRIVMANNSVRCQLGLKPEELTGKYCPKVVHGIDGPFPGCPLEEAVATGGPVEKEIFDKNSGQWMVSAIYPTKLRGIDGRAIYFHMVSDITRRKQAEEELLFNYRNQEVLDAILSISLMDISLPGQLDLILNRLISVPWLGLLSRGAILLTKGDSQTLVMKAHCGLAKPLLELCARVPFGRCMCGRAASSGSIEFADRLDDRHEHEYEGISPHGHYCVPIMSEGNVLGVMNLYLKEGHRSSEKEERFLRSVADIVAGTIRRARTEQELEEKGNLLDAATDSIFVHDFEGKFHYLNEAAHKSRGYTRDELMNLDLTVLDVPEYAQLIEPRIQELIETGETTFESAHFRKDKSKMPVEVHARLIESEDQKLILSVVRDITAHKQAEVEIKRSFEQLQKTLHDTVNALASVVDMRDPYTSGHQQRVADLAAAIAEEMGLRDDEIEGIRMSGVIHDIGKIYVPAEILSKPGKLTETEFSMVKTHAQVGHDILKSIEFPWPVAQIVHQHHERINGSGYPQRLAGDGILLEAKILAVADVVEAMASHRPYRPARGLEKALEEISQNKGVLYDPGVVDACLALFTKKAYVLD